MAEDSVPLSSPFQLVSRNSFKGQIARELTRLIVTSHYKPGDCLPTERELAQQFDVSRTVIREAVSVVTAQGFLDVRHGSGMFVTPPDSWNAMHPLILLATDRRTALLELIQARALLEPEVAALAAQRATAEDIAALAEMVSLAGGVDEHVDRDMAFHLILAKSSHNQVLLVMLSSINDLMYEVRRDIFATRDVIQLVFSRHSLILEKVRQRDVEGACEAMRQHLEEAKEDYLASVQAHLQGLQDQKMLVADAAVAQNS